MNNLSDILNSLNQNEKMKNTIYELLKPYINLVIDRLTIYLIFFILIVAISFILHLGVLIILIKYLNKK